MGDTKDSAEDNIENLQTSEKIEKLKACFERYCPDYQFDFKLRLPIHPGDDFGLFEIYYKKRKETKFKPVIFSRDNPEKNSPEIVIKFLIALNNMQYLIDLDRKGAIDPDKLILKQKHYESGKGKDYEDETLMQKNFVTNFYNYLSLKSSLEKITNHSIICKILQEDENSSLFGPPDKVNFLIKASETRHQDRIMATVKEYLKKYGIKFDTRFAHKVVVQGVSTVPAPTAPEAPSSLSFSGASLSPDKPDKGDKKSGLDQAEVDKEPLEPSRKKPSSPSSSRT